MSAFLTQNIGGVSMEDFNNYESFRKLQTRFIDKCYSRSYGDTPTLPEDYRNDFRIILQTVRDDFDGNWEEVGLQMVQKDFYFIADYLNAEIPKLSERYINQVKDNISKYYLADEKERKNYILLQRHQINNLYENIEDYNFIGEELLQKLKSEIIKALEFIYDDSLVEEELTNLGKIPINMPEIDFINVMMQLADNSFIKVYNDVELANIIQNKFTIYKGKDQENKPIKNCYKKINGYRNGSKPNYKSLERIRELFKKFN